MIKGIAKIKGLGVYANYTKPVGTQEFGIKNLIYGWNYSGKTTLSRLFALLEGEKPNPDVSGCEFAFETEGQPITDKNFDQCGFTVRVFNSILLLGKESEEAQKRIDRLNERIRKSEATRKRLNGLCDAITQTVADDKTKAARNTRQLLKIDPYTATHLNNDVLAVGLLDSQLLAEKDLEQTLGLARTPDDQKPSTVDKISTSPSIAGLHTEAISLLAATPSFSNTLKHLEEHPEIER